jgi:esterase/lipase
LRLAYHNDRKVKNVDVGIGKEDIHGTATGHLFFPGLRRDSCSLPQVQEMVLQQARLHNSDATIDFSDPQVVIAIKRSIRLSISALNELFSLLDEVRARLGTLRFPLLIIQSNRDQTVMPACAEELFSLTTSATPKSLQWLEHSDHVITMAPEREEVFKLGASFIQSTVQAQSS